MISFGSGAAAGYRHGPSRTRAGEPVADELLVEAGLHDTRPVAVGGPIPRRVGRENFVGQHQATVAVDPELELGVGDDDSPRQSVIGRLHIDLQRTVAQLVGAHPADQLDHPGKRNVLVVVAQCGLRRRSKQRCGELAGLDQARRQGDTADLPGRLVVQQSRAGQVAASHTFHRKHLESPHHQRAAEHLVGDPRVIRWPGQVVGRIDKAEEEHAHGGQDAALVRDGAVEDIVVRRNPVGGDQQQVLVVDTVQLTNLAAGQMLVVGQRGAHRVTLAGSPVLESNPVLVWRL